MIFLDLDSPTVSQTYTKEYPCIEFLIGTQYISGQKLSKSSLHTVKKFKD